MQPIITMDYGSGGLRTAELIEEILLPAFGNAALNDLGDGAVLPDLGGPPVFSTDSFVVTPWQFPGGDIGKLSVCGTVNDLACMGAKPLYMTCAFVLEEGAAGGPDSGDPCSGRSGRILRDEDRRVGGSL